MLRSTTRPLMPLPRVGRRSACVKEGIDTTAKSPSHVLPGGIGTYTINHIPYLYHNYQRVPKPEVSPMFTVSLASSNERNATEENSLSNCSSYGASGFTLWDESVEKKEHTSKKNARGRTKIRDAAATMGQWQGIDQRSSGSSLQ